MSEIRRTAQTLAFGMVAANCGPGLVGWFNLVTGWARQKPINVSDPKNGSKTRWFVGVLRVCLQVVVVVVVVVVEERSVVCFVLNNT